MKSKLCVLAIYIGLLGALFVPVPPPPYKLPIPQALAGNELGIDWHIEAGDKIIVDVGSNRLWMVRKDNSVASEPFGIGSGYNDGRLINWLGMTYDPATPVDEWMIETKNQQSLCWVFCANRQGVSDQTFLRLYRMNDTSGEYEYSRYGIHSTPNFNTILSSMDGFGSYGCVLADYDLLKFLEEMFDHHQALGENLKVVTVDLS
jgi:hypothetical protein